MAGVLRAQVLQVGQDLADQLDVLMQRDRERRHLQRRPHRERRQGLQRRPHRERRQGQRRLRGLRGGREGQEQPCRGAQNPP